MRTAVINIKIEPKIKEQARKIAADLGFSLSTVINGYLKHFIKTETLYFTTLPEEPSDYLIQALKESEEERKRGDYFSFKNSQKALDFLDKIIAKKRKR